MSKPHPLLATTTAPNLETAERIARRLVEERLAACVQIVEGIRSVYRWQGQVQEEPEVLLIVKTAEPQLPRIESLLREIHPYELPELAAVPITSGSAAYLRWLAECL
jgi:periplasmic divalent cation tolerance protein